MDLGLRDKVVVVAGSSRGIGYAIAEGFLAEGARVAVSGREREPLELAASELAQRHGNDRVAWSAGDLAVPEARESLLEATRERLGAPDCVVLNVGTGSGKAGWEVDPEDWARSFDANLWTSVRMAESALPGLLERDAGSLVFVASIVGVESVSAPLPYSTAKSALVTYAKGLARELGPRGVRVNCVAPGNVLFPGGSWDEKVQADPERWHGYVETEVPLGRFGDPAEIAAAVVFLASEPAAFITGECLVVDGGQTRRW